MKIDRLIGIVSILLQQELVTAPVLAEKFEVSRRTINRDIEALCMAGIPVMTKQGADGGISIMKEYKIDKTLLTSKEMQAILRGLKSLDSMAGSHQYEILMDKISMNHSKILASDPYIQIDLTNWNTKKSAPRITMIQQAIESCHTITFHYVSPEKESTRTIEPYLLLFRWNAWYVHGRCMDQQAFRLFKLARMEEVTVNSERFVRIENVEVPDIPEQIYNPNSLEVTAVFDKKSRWRLIEELGSEKMEELIDGRIRITFPWSDKESLFSYLLGFRENVVLVEPQELVDELKILLTKINDNYAS